MLGGLAAALIATLIEAQIKIGTNARIARMSTR